MRIVILVFIALLLSGCGSEVINKNKAIVLQKPILLSAGDDQKARSLTSVSFTVSSIEPGQSYRQGLIISNVGNKPLRLLVAVKSPLWLDNDGYKTVTIPAHQRRGVLFYFIGEEEASARQGKIGFTLANL